MAYFIPSYLQKRLLRYALSRLDLIEDDNLDLDNLGLTFGQRSVVELKNVSIKVKRIAEQANLPSSVVIDHASLRLLRVTVPADLHASGIVIEVEGVDIQIKVLHEDQIRATSSNRKRQSHAPSHTDKANRPRLSSPPIHDPGGEGRSPRGRRHLETSRVLPTSEDLAASFLESEPIEEKQELEAALGSQSRLQESTSSSGFGNDGDLGMAAGLTLPSFVATFFSGVAGRLSMTAQDVRITVQMSLSPDEGDISTFALKVGQVQVNAVSDLEGGAAAQSFRQISIKDIRSGLEVEPDILSQASSPRLQRSSTKGSMQYVSHDGAASGVSREPSTPQSLTATSSPDLNASLHDLATSPTFGLQKSGSSTSPSSRLFRSGPNPSASLFASTELQAPFDVDNKVNAEMQASFAPPSPESERASASSAGSKLAESKLFTHEEAESMYMSAISGQDMSSTAARPMPGGWDWSEPASQLDEDPTNMPTPMSLPEDSGEATPTEQVPEADPRNENPSTPPATHQSEIPPPAPPVIPETRDDSPTIFSQIMKLDYLRLTLPSHQPQQASDHLGHTDLKTRTGSFPTGRPSESLAYSTINDSRKNATFDSRSALEVKAGTLTVDIDLRVCKILIRAAQELANKLPQPQIAAEGPSAATGARGINVALNALLVNFREVSMPSYRSSVSESSATSATDEPLLCLSLSSISYQQSGLDRTVMTITKIALRHNMTGVLGFIETVNVRDSIASSAMLRPHDLSVTMSDSRVEVQLKPVHIALDLLLMDELLSRSGGLSSLIDLGNSIASTTTVKKGTQETKPRSVPQRTVRFNDPSQRSRSPTDPSPTGSKVNLRIGGSVIDLVGSETKMQVKSSALKLAWRDGQARVVIDGAVIEGPIIPNSRQPTGISFQAKSLDIRYLDAPEETDLDRLLSLITPSSDKYDNDDDIMVDTLLRQRRKGGVLRLTLGEVKADARGLDWQSDLIKLSDEASKLSSVTKYLPEDDRPGILTFALINKLNFRFDLDHAFGPLILQAELLEGAHINVPSLAAAQISSWSLARGGNDVLIGEVLPQNDAVMGPPMLMLRFVADEMEPTVRLKLSNTCLEYKVATVIAVTDLAQRLTPNKSAARPENTLSRQSSPSASSSSEDSSSFARKVKVSTAFRDSGIALHPTGSPAKGLFVLSDAVVGYDGHKKGSNVSLELKKASLLIINNTESLGEGLNNADQMIYFDQNDQIQQLAKHGFVPVGSMSSASAIIKISQEEGQDQHLDVEFRNNLLFLETCADSTQTLFQILGGLSPPTPPSAKVKYRTEVVPIEDMLASFTGNAFVSEQGPELGLQASKVSTTASGQDDYDEDYDDGGYMNDLYAEEADYEMTASYVESDVAESTASLHLGPVDITTTDDADLAQSMIAHSMLDFRTEHFAGKGTTEGTAHRWDSTKNTYDLASDEDFKKSPLKVRIRDVHIIWNLFDGYDWQATRDTISHAVREVETKAMMRRPRSGTRLPSAEDDESVIGDVLFNSIYISVPANKDPRDLTSAINHEIDDMVSETGSYATGTTVTATPSRRQSGHGYRPKKLKLNRSKHHKMSFELEGVSADILAFPPGTGEVESSTDIRVRKLEIFDHLPTSTWRKFATYMHEAGEREVDTSMVHLELLNVKPVADLDATEIVMRLTILPLRLHVDQDALDFLARFFEFKDDSISPSIASSAPPFIQRAEVNPVQLRLDYKPKKVDYAGLRSGRTTEFMNFFILDRADMVLRRIILHGVSGFDRLGLMLNDIWSPDVRRNQLPTVLSGLAPVRPLVDVASGVRDLIAVPIREYKKDGRIVRSIQKGAIAFAKTTGTELVNLGAKLAIGTQGILQTAEGMLVPDSQEVDDEMKKQRSLYADQPLGIVQGLRGAYASLERDLLLARDAIVAVPGEIMASDSATGAAKAVLKQSPTIILRPAIGATKAVGQTLLGAGNTLDRRNLRRIEDKYKRY